MAVLCIKTPFIHRLHHDTFLCKPLYLFEFSAHIATISRNQVVFSMEIRMMACESVSFRIDSRGRRLNPSID